MAELAARSHNVSFLPLFRGFTIRSHFSAAVSASLGRRTESQRIVFALFSWVYDTFSLYRHRFGLPRTPDRVTTYRFCPFFVGLRYVLTFLLPFRPPSDAGQSHNVSFLLYFRGFTIRSHFTATVSASLGRRTESQRIVFAPFSWVYDTFSLFCCRFCLTRTPHRVRTYRFCSFFMGLRYVLTFLLYTRSRFSMISLIVSSDFTSSSYVHIRFVCCTNPSRL